MPIDLPTDPMAPFVIGEGSDGVLLSHGLGGSPYELRDMAATMAEQGFRAANVRLAGHARGEAALERTGWRDWWESLVGSYADLAQKCDRVFFCGLSMGGLLGLKLAAHYPVAALAVMATPVYLRHPLFPMASLLQHFMRFKPEGERDIRDPVARATSPDTGRTPMAAVASLRDLMQHVRPELPQVTCSLLVVHSKGDKVVPFHNMSYINRTVGSADVSTLPLERSGHVIPLDYDKELVRRRVAEFFVEQARS